MDKRERISQFVQQTEAAGDLNTENVASHPFYRAYFRCWNDQKYYDAHDVLEQLWLNSDTPDDNFFKGLIQAAGAFVHLQKNFEHPNHTKHSRRLQPAARLFALAEKNLATYGPRHHDLDVAGLLHLLSTTREQIISSEFKTNPWSPATAPKLHLRS